MLSIRSFLYVGFFLVVSVPTGAGAGLDPWGDTRYFAYVGQYTDTRYTEILLFDTDFQSSYVAVLGATTRIANVGDHGHIEAEINFGQHWGRQNNREVNALASARWRRFPWNHRVATSLAIGTGVSVASRVPEIEDLPHRPGARRLVYLMHEIEFSRPSDPHLSLFLRIHHRSGLYDVVSEARGSNFLGMGVRRAL
jgi:hypothetical protein